MKEPVDDNATTTPPGKFGYFNLSPKWLQWMNNPWLFLLCVSVLTIGQTLAVVGLLTFIVTQLEKRFNFSSFDIGMIAASNDVAAVVFGLVVSHYGNFGNKVRWIGIGGIIIGIGFIIFTLPHHIIGRYRPPPLTYPKLVCTPPLNTTATSHSGDCNEGIIAERYHLALLLIGQFVAGVGSMPLYAFTPSIFQECCTPKNMPIFLGIWQCSVVAGPVVAFGISNPILEMYVDIDQPEGFEMTPLDPRWIANWWVGYLCAAAVVFLASFVILAYPADIKKQDGAPKLTMVEDNENQLTMKAKIRKFPTTLKRLLTNWAFIFNCMGLNTTLLYGEGIAPFIARIMILRYGLEATRVGNALILATAPPVLLGVLIGSIITRAFEPEKSGKRSALIVFLLQLLIIVGPLSFLTPGCSNMNLAGWKVQYSDITNNTLNGVNLLSRCNSNCDCDLSVAIPICGSDNVTYLSGCYAGCSGISGYTTDDPPLPIFGNCSCIDDDRYPVGGTATIGHCDQGCQNWLLFLCLSGLVTLFAFIQLTPSKYVLTRCVEPQDISFAFGFQYLLTKVFAHIPGPILFGRVADNVCVIWQKVCDETGYCWVHNMDSQMKTITIITATLSCLGMLFYFLSWLLYKESQALQNEKPCDNTNIIENKNAQQSETKL